MAYTDFTLDTIEQKFGVTNRTAHLFERIEPVLPSQTLLEALETALELPLRSEKAKSESIVFPLLVELRKRNNKFFTIYSGDNLNADEEQGLKGECDFILAKDVQSFNLNFPIISIVEAKRNDVEIGIPQCAAQLIGARIFNEKKGKKIDTLYGCVTTGNDWIFLKLEENLTIDSKLYYLNDIPTILGVFQNIIDFYKERI